MKKVLICLLLITLCGCTKQEETIDDITSDEPFEIESIVESTSYPHLSELYIKNKDGDLIFMMIPSDYHQVETTFLNSDASNLIWTFFILEEEDIN